jgi:hypothetical protein
MNQNTQGNKEQTIFQRQEEKKSIRNHKRGDRLAEKPLKNRKAIQRKIENSHSSISGFLVNRKAKNHNHKVSQASLVQKD